MWAEQAANMQKSVTTMESEAHLYRWAANTNNHNWIRLRLNERRVAGNNGTVVATESSALGPLTAPAGS